MPPHHAARLRLLALGAAAAAQAAALAAVTTFSLKLVLAGRYHAFDPGALAGWLGLAGVPVLILAPLVGVLAGSGRPWAALVGSAAVAVGVIGWGVATTDPPWLSCVGILTLAGATSAAAILTLLPPVARSARLGQPTAGALLWAGVGGGLLAGAYLGIERYEPVRDGTPAAGTAALVLAIIGFASAAAARIRPAEWVPLSEGVAKPFLAGVRDAGRHRRTRRALIGLVVWFFVAAAILVGVVRLRVPADDPEGRVWESTLTVGLAGLGGVLLTLVNRNPYRHGWPVLPAALAVLGCVLWLRFGEAWTGPLVGLGLSLGAAFPPLVNFYLTWTTPRHHGVAAALLAAGWGLAAAALAGVLASAADNALLDVLVGVGAVAAVGAGWGFFRPALEGVAEFLLWPVYRIRATGPGLENLPASGPCLVIGNHAAWFDPLFLAKILPAPIVPMMTSRFYDLPVLSWIMRHVIGTIRVPETPYRHEAPELQEAVRALDAGACVVLFPEGYLRRREEQPLRRFGRGVWKILADRPNTPVFACWIEGNWGSYFSYRGGPPTKNKRFDRWLPLRIGVVGPVTLDPAVLADHMATRTYLMRQVAAAREPLGLPPLALPAAAEGDKE